MSIPGHSINCISRAYPTKCSECTDDVWFFSCTCGSKIFFKELGFPWEVHLCRKYHIAQQIQLIKDSERLSDDEIYKIITGIEKKGRQIDDETVTLLAEILGKRKFPLKVTLMVPTEKTDFSGTIMEFNRQVNIFKKLGYDPPSEMSIKLLGKIGQNKWGQITVRTHSNNRNECFEYEIYVLQDRTNEVINKGKKIAGILDVVSHPKGKICQLFSYHIL